MAHETLWHWGPPSCSAAQARPIWGVVREVLLQQLLEGHEKRFVRCVAYGMPRKFRIDHHNYAVTEDLSR